MKKLGVLLGAVALAVVGLTGCSSEITAEEGAAWAAQNGYVVSSDYMKKTDVEANYTKNTDVASDYMKKTDVASGYTKNTEIDYTGWATKNGYSKQREALPAARLANKDTLDADYAVANSGIVINPAEGQKKLADYLDLEGVVYIDAREYGSYLKGHIEGFENLPYNEIIGGNGKQLFKVDGDTVTDRYEESKAELKRIIPTDKVLFLMCQSGARIVSFMKVLKHCGYDMSKVYNVGGFNHVANAKEAEITYNVTATTISIDDKNNAATWYTFPTKDFTPKAA